MLNFWAHWKSVGWIGWPCVLDWVQRAGPASMRLMQVVQGQLEQIWEAWGSVDPIRANPDGTGRYRNYQGLSGYHRAVWS